jgi:hypothetical protein
MFCDVLIISFKSELGDLHFELSNMFIHIHKIYCKQYETSQTVQGRKSCFIPLKYRSHNNFMISSQHFNIMNGNCGLMKTQQMKET